MDRRLTAVPRRATLVALLAASALIPAAPATAHGPAPAGMTETRLRAFEEKVLGHEHAAEHALQRRLARRARRAGVRPKRIRPQAFAAQAAEAPADGAWAGPYPILLSGQNRGVMAINAVMLPTGKVLWFSYPVEPGSAVPQDQAFAVLWDPATGGFKDVPPPIDPRTGKPANIWCAGTSLTADGRVVVAGGNAGYQTAGASYKGLNQVYTFDPFTEKWQRHEDMRKGRWYPSQLLMPDGRTVIIQGLDESGTNTDNLDIEIFDPSKPVGQDVTKIGELPAWAHGDYYPHTFWMPSGRGLIAGPDPLDSWFLTPPGAGNVFAPRDAANPARRRTWGTGVLLPLSYDSRAGTVLQIGGSDTLPNYDQSPATPSSEAYAEASNRWTAAPRLNIARSHANTVLLPDGGMVEVGGGVGSDGTRNGLWTANPEQRAVELRDPSTGAWRLGAAQAESRAYHSTALLLPDGRVVSAGDDRNGGFDRDSYEVYSPPYLFRGPRPVISSSPPETSYGRTIWVGTPNTDIDRAVLVAPGAATHAVDMNQRVIVLPAARRADGLGYDLRTPATADIAPPGYYMLFLVDSAGRPSVARWVRVFPGAPEQQPPPRPAPPAPTPPTPPSTGPDSTADTKRPYARVRLRTRSVRVARRTRTLKLSLRLNEPGRLKATITLVRVRKAKTHTRKVSFAQAGKATRRVRLSRATARRLPRRGMLEISVRLGATDVAGNRSRRTVVLKLRH